MHHTLALRCALMGFGLSITLVAPLAGSPHAVSGLDPARAYDVLQDGIPILTGRLPDLDGVLVFDASGAGAFQIVASGSADTQPPATVEDLRAIGSSLTSLTLAWTAPGDDGASGRASEYEIRWATEAEDLHRSPNFDDRPPAPAPAGSEETHVLNDLPMGSTIYVALRARDDAGLWGALSNVVVDATDGVEDGEPPAAIADLVGDTLDSTTVRLTWTAPGDDGMQGTASFYEIRWSTSVEGLLDAPHVVADPPVPGPAGSAEEFHLSGLPAGTTIVTAIRSRDDAGNWSDLSNLATVTTEENESGGGPTQDSQRPDVIANFRVEGAHPHWVDLTWRASGDDGMEGIATAYDLRFSDAPIDSLNFDDAHVVWELPEPQEPGAIEQFRVTGLRPRREYYLAIVAVDEVGNTSPIESSLFALTRPGYSTPLEPPDEPEGRFEDGAIVLRWAPSPNPSTAGYWVYRRADGGMGHRVNAMPTRSTELIDPLVNEGSGYHYWVTAVDAELNESQAGSETWLRASAVAPPVAQLRTFPNPVRGDARFRVQIPELANATPGQVPVTIDVYDVAGRRLARVFDGPLSPGERQITWHQEGTAMVPGLYVAVLTVGREKALSRFAFAP